MKFPAESPIFWSWDLAPFARRTLARLAMPHQGNTLLTTPRFRVVEFRPEDEPARPPVTRQVVIHPGSAVIIPLLEGDRLCLIRNYRVAFDRELIELPAGTLDPGESAEETARRELTEETGFTATSWRALPTIVPSPGILNERMHLFVAEGLTAGDTAREAGEQIENWIIPWSDAVRMVLEGEIEDAKTLVGILLWDRLRQQVS